MQLTSRALEAALNARITALTMSVVYELYCDGLSSVIHALNRPGATEPSGLRAGFFSYSTPGVFGCGARSWFLNSSTGAIGAFISVCLLSLVQRGCSTTRARISWRCTAAKME